MPLIVGNYSRDPDRNFGPSDAQNPWQSECGSHPTPLPHRGLPGRGLAEHGPLCGPAWPICRRPSRRRYRLRRRSAVGSAASSVGRRQAAFNADRLFNRHLVLTAALRRAADFKLFHVADHTYAHVVLALPPGRVSVYCHDLDAFRCLLDPAAEPRPWWFRRLARRTLAGLRAAAIVFHNSREVGRQLVAAEIVPPCRLVYAPLGVADEFTPWPATRRERIAPFLLHVGSNIPRKRIDVLLDVFGR